VSGCYAAPLTQGQATTGRVLHPSGDRPREDALMTPEELEELAYIYENSISKDARVIIGLLKEIERLNESLAECTCTQSDTQSA
jgi:hypothetical protein